MFGAALCGVSAGGCDSELDRLYALPLDHVPTEMDWEAAVGFHVQASGGRTSQAGEGTVDSDAVHASTASCHHGTQVPAIDVAVRAFHTAERLYLRIEWVDPTPDLGPSWSWDGRAWRAGGAGEDGLAILWGENPQEFSCAQACHLEDWRVEGPRAFADYRMVSPEDSPPLDLWIWRAGRGKAGGTVEDAMLGPEGKGGDTPGDLHASNSLRARSGQAGAFGREDGPWQAPDPEPGATAPGYLTLPDAGGRVEVAGRGTWDRGWWRVILSRSLVGSESNDVRFVLGAEHVFGLAIFDGVDRDHSAVPSPIRLVLVEPSALESQLAKAEE